MKSSAVVTYVQTEKWKSEKLIQKFINSETVGIYSCGFCIKESNSLGSIVSTQN